MYLLRTWNIANTQQVLFLSSLTIATNFRCDVIIMTLIWRNCIYSHCHNTGVHIISCTKKLMKDISLWGMFVWDKTNYSYCCHFATSLSLYIMKLIGLLHVVEIYVVVFFLCIFDYLNIKRKTLEVITSFSVYSL